MLSKYQRYTLSLAPSYSLSCLCKHSTLSRRNQQLLCWPLSRLSLYVNINPTNLTWPNQQLYFFVLMQLLWKLVPIQVVFLWYLTHHALEFSENLQVYAYPKVEGDVVIWASNSYANGTKIIFEDSQWRFSIEALLLACDNPFTQIWKPTCLFDNTCITLQGHCHKQKEYLRLKEEAKQSQ